MKQKIIKVGNSYGLILPKEIIAQMKIKEGEALEVEAYPSLSMLMLRSAHAPYITRITPEFKGWLDNFVKKHKDLLKKLARTP